MAGLRARAVGVSVGAIRNAPLEVRPDPVVGWRLWRVRGDQLESWAASFAWAPGANEACCLASMHRCKQAPGRGCGCGFWGVFSPLGALGRGRGDRTERSSVLGLIRGWGQVALHGEEGFRAQYASIACLFTDWIWDAAAMPCPEGGVPRLWWKAQRRVGYVPRPLPADGWRLAAINEAAGRYGVPALSLREALRLGMLEEFGAGERMRAEVQRWLDMVEWGRLRSSD